MNEKNKKFFEEWIETNNLFDKLMFEPNNEELKKKIINNLEKNIREVEDLERRKKE